MKKIYLLISFSLLMFVAQSQTVVKFTSEGKSFQELVIKDTLHFEGKITLVDSKDYKLVSNGLDLKRVDQEIEGDYFVFSKTDIPIIRNVINQVVKKPRVTGIYFYQYDSIIIKKVYHETYNELYDFVPVGGRAY